MIRIFLPNLTFEEELDGRDQQVSGTVVRLVSELGCAMGLLSDRTKRFEERDIVLIDDDVDLSGIPESLQQVRFQTVRSLEAGGVPDPVFVPWGWSPSAVAVAHRLGLNPEAPALSTIRRINSREFLAEFDLCHALSDSTAVESVGILCWTLPDVQSALERFAVEHSKGWVIKSNISQAARNRLIGNRRFLSENDTRWLNNRFKIGEPVCAEPWLDCIAECGMQFTIPAPAESQEIRFEGAAEMLTDTAGRYRGSVISRDSTASWWHSAVMHCRQIAERVRACGFWGPIGMDCMLFRRPLDGLPWIRMCHDINGRNTMGRVALALRPYLDVDEIGYWCHGSEKSKANGQNVFDCLDATDVRIVPTSPDRIGSTPTNLRTALLISKDCERLNQVTRKILGQNIRGPFTPN